jgi:hypothetical protein
MDEYIEREAAIKAIEKADYTLIANDADSCKADYLREIIESVPAADVVPVVRGEWVRPHWKNTNFCYDCSVCGNEVMHQEYRWRDKKIYPICPWCGAKMDGGADND